MTAQEIRKAYLEFFEKRGHKVIPRALLVPKEDATTLFTGSGMQPLIPYLLGEKHPDGKRLVDSQTCLRAQDIEDVGNNRHTTFFEMLGNWSMGDYFKEEQIPWFFEFLVDVVGLDPKRIYVTCFIGNVENSIPRDDTSARIWQRLFEEKGIEAKIAEIGSQADGDKRGMNPGERIFFYDDGENWWSRAGGISKTPIGDPCGPDSEVFYDFGEENHAEGYGEPHPASDSGRFIEIGNQVFMEYKRTESGFEKLAKPNVDFGGGLERIAAAKIDSPDVFKISLLWPIVEKLEVLSGSSYDDKTEDMRIIADHLRGAMFLAVDGVRPSNKEQGYVMRRLMRRAILKAFDLGIEDNFLQELASVIADLYRDDFPELMKNEEEVVTVLVKEEKAFKQTLRKGLKFLLRAGEEHEGVRIISGEEVFKAYDTHGYPPELTKELLTVQPPVTELELSESNKLATVKLAENWKEVFDKKMLEQKERSRTAAKGAFKGGLGGHEDIHKKYHTATHLMYQALRDVLGDHVVQHGSNITDERLRFDFSHPEKMTLEEIKRVEDIVNDKITEDLSVSWEEFPTNVAREEKGALGQFGDRYGQTVKVYSMQSNTDKPFSFEICGGPHVDHTAQLAEDGKRFKITKEQSSSAGIRRIKAVLV